jgi:hypothetical protein
MSKHAKNEEKMTNTSHIEFYIFIRVVSLQGKVYSTRFTLQTKSPNSCDPYVKMGKYYCLNQILKRFRTSKSFLPFLFLVLVFGNTGINLFFFNLNISHDAIRSDIMPRIDTANKLESNSSTSNSSSAHFVNFKFFPNHMWMFNYNVMQYSAYIIQNNTDRWLECMVKIRNSDYDESFVDNSKTSLFVGLVKILSTMQTVEMKILKMYSTWGVKAHKVYLAYDEKLFGESEIAVAFVQRQGFNTLIDNTYSSPGFQDIINFQRPDDVSVHEPRLPALGHCIKQIYTQTELLKSFLDMQKSFGLKEIILHDATQSGFVWNLVAANKQLYDFVTVRPYDFNETEICENPRIIIGNESLINAYRSECRQFVMEMHQHTDVINLHQDM